MRSRDDEERNRFNAKMAAGKSDFSVAERAAGWVRRARKYGGSRGPQSDSDCSACMRAARESSCTRHYTTRSLISINNTRCTGQNRARLRTPGSLNPTHCHPDPVTAHENISNNRTISVFPGFFCSHHRKRQKWNGGKFEFYEEKKKAFGQPEVDNIGRLQFKLYLWTWILFKFMTGFFTC